METIDIFYQGHGIREIEHIEVRRDHTVAMIREILIESHGCHAETLIFIEDEETPLEHHLIIGEICVHNTAKLHLHRCRQVEVTVVFAGTPKSKKFAPGATVDRIKHWAAITEFHMTEPEAGEHRLQLAGTHDRPNPGVHVGTLASCPDCQVKFDLVPDERVNGGS